MRGSIVVVGLASAIALLACSDDDDCSSGVRVEGRCLGAVPDGGDQDAAADDGDAASDGGGDAGGGEGEGEGEGERECEPACGGATPLCDLRVLECVACLSDDDCAEPTPRCNPGSGTCVVCVEASDCAGVVGRPQCLFAVECVQCREDGDCGARSPAPHCDPAVNECVPCAPGGPECARVGACFADGLSAGDDTLAETAAGSCVGCNESADCESEDACDPWAHECVIARGNVQWCEPCFADDDCEAGDACVVVSWPAEGGAIVGTVCARDCADAGGFPDGDTRCASEIGRGTVCRTTVGRDGAAHAACLPAASTCEGFRDAAARAPCATAEECGADAMDDGLCVAGEDSCTIACASIADCPAGFDLCEGDPQRCR